MKIFPIILIVFWLIVITFPEFLAYLIGGFFVFIWLNMLFIWFAFSKKTKSGEDNYIKFWKYKIYR